MVRGVKKNGTKRVNEEGFNGSIFPFSLPSQPHGDGSRDLVAVAMPNGSLLIGQIVDHTYQVLYMTNLEKKHIQKVSYLPSYDLLVVLANNELMCLRVPSFTPIAAFQHSFNVQSYVLSNQTKSKLRMAIILKSKKLVLLDWVPDSNQWHETHQFQTIQSVLNLCWMGDLLCVGTKSNFLLLNAHEGTSGELIGLEKSAVRPRAYALSENNTFLILTGTMGFEITTDGTKAIDHVVTWPEVPLEVTICHPYLLARMNQTIEIRMLSPPYLAIQDIKFKTDKFFAATIPHHNDYQPTDKWTSHSGGMVLSASKQHVSIIKMASLQQQLKYFVSSQRFQEAEWICQNFNSKMPHDIKTEWLRLTRWLYAIHLFKEGKFSQAFSLFTTIDVDPIRVLALVPPMVWKWSSNQPQPLITNEILVQASKLLPSPTNLAEISGNLHEQRDVGIQSTSKREFDILTTLSWLPVQDINYFDLNTDHLADNSLWDQLARYLCTKRIKAPGIDPLGSPQDDPCPSWDQVSELSVILDTALLELYLHLDLSRLRQLLRVSNHCHLKRSATLLEWMEMYIELVLLYKSKNHHKEALELLEKLSSKPGLLQGISASISYLSDLGRTHWPLIKKHARWCLLKSPSEAIKILTSPREPHHSLDPMDTLVYLREIWTPARSDSSLSKNSGKLMEAEPWIAEYLENIIFDQGDQTVQVHDTLAKLYFDVILNPTGDAGENERKERIKEHPWRPRLQRLLQTSHYYHAEPLLSCYSFDEFGLYEEKAALLSRIGQHKAAIQEYIVKLGDLTRAESYCNAHYDRDSPKCNDLFLILIKLLTTPIGQDQLPDPSYLQYAFKVMLEHHDKLPPLEVIKLLPPLIPFNSLYPYLNKIWAYYEQQRRQLSIKKNLSMSEVIKTKLELNKHLRKMIKITDSTCCQSCKRKIGESLLTWTPQGTIYHYKCYQDRVI